MVIIVKKYLVDVTKSAGVFTARIVQPEMPGVASGRNYDTVVAAIANVIERAGQPGKSGK